MGSLGLCLEGLGGSVLLEGVNYAKDSFCIGLALLLEPEGYLGPLEEREEDDLSWSLGISLIIEYSFLFIIIDKILYSLMNSKTKIYRVSSTTYI